METLFKNQNRIKGAFSSDFFTKRYNAMEKRLELKIEVLTRQICSFWRIIRIKDETILKLKKENNDLKIKLLTFDECDRFANLF